MRTSGFFLSSPVAERLRQNNRMGRFLRPFSENHVVYSGGVYYKFPNYPGLFYGSRDTAERTLRKYLRVVKETFGDIAYIPKTRICHGKNGWFLAQSAVSGVGLSVETLQANPKARLALECLVQANDALWGSHGLSLDYCGTDAILRPSVLHNLLWTGEKIAIIDIGLLDAKSINLAFRAVSVGIYSLQRTLLEEVFLSAEDWKV